MLASTMTCVIFPKHRSYSRELRKTLIEMDNLEDRRRNSIYFTWLLFSLLSFRYDSKMSDDDCVLRSVHSRTRQGHVCEITVKKGYSENPTFHDAELK